MIGTSGAPDDRSETRRVTLSGVPETMLWPLWNRAAEARRPEPRIVDDPMAADLVARIDYDFAGRFGKPTAFHPIRARVCDDLIRAHLARSPEEPVVVALGEGLETQIWRIADDRVRWISVDLPEAIGVRRELLPSHPRETQLKCSALDPAWMDAVPAGSRPFITAAGLLMYFQEADVRRLLAGIAERFAGAEVFFDTITAHISRRTMRGWKVTKRYRAPPMPWGIAVDDLPGFIRAVPGLEVGAVRSYADPFPERMRLYKLLSNVPPLRRRYAGGLAHARVRPRPE